MKSLRINKLLTAIYSALKTIALIISVLFITFNNANAQNANKYKVSIEAKEWTLVQIFDALQQQTEFNFAYTDNITNDESRYTLKYNQAPLELILTNLSKIAGFEFKTMDKKISIRKLSKQKISGKITDEETQEPLIGVSVLIEGTSEGTITDIDGNYSLYAYPNSTLKVSYISFESQSADINNKKDLHFSMKPSTTGLSEVLVVGYANQERKDITGAIDGVKAGAFNDGVISNTEQLFQGKISGVRVINSSGEPGAGVDVMIRGAGSIRSGNSPLFVVDGMPLSNDAVSPEGINGGVGSARAKNPLNFLNPTDIESISILKDASAAAIYGARGSNGVILITSKKGKSDKAHFTFDSYVGISKVAKKLDLLTGAEYAEVNPEQTYDDNVSTDWQDALLRTAISKSNNLSISNNNQNGNYYMSVSHLDQEGIIKESNFERFSGRFNVSQSFFDDKRLKINANITASQTKDMAVPTSDNGGATGELITHMLKANPTRPIYDESGALFDFDTEGSYNPLYMLSFYDDQTKTLRVLGNIEAKYRIIQGLEYKLNYGVDRSVSERNTTYYANTTEIESDGAYYQQNYDMNNYLLEHSLSYNRSFKAHKLTALAGFSYQYFDRSGTTFGVTGIEDNSVDPANNPSIGTDQNAIETKGFAEINELQSYFGRLNYSYKQKYLATASVRVDGSTRFGANNKYGYFPSFALGWNLSNEHFLQNSTFINELKIRASWGQTGNQEVPNKVTNETYSVSSSTGYYLNGESSDLINGITYTRTANPDLKWEVVSQLNFGLDYRLFKGKLYGSLDLFNKTTTDAILLLPAIQPNFSNVWTNMDGEIVNKGFEFTIGSKLINRKNLSLTVNLNGATLDNEVKNLPLSEILSGSVSGSGVSGETVNIYKNGYAAGSFYLKEHLGYDENGISIYSEEKKITESALPKFTYGLSSALTYKNIDLSFTITGQNGAYLFNNTKSATNVMSNLLGSKNVTQDVLNSGQSPNDALVISDYYLEKSDYLRLNNVRLGYTIRTSKIKWLSLLNIYATGQNLVTLTDYSGYDPSVNTSKNVGGNSSLGMDYASYPSARTFLFGITIKY